MSSEVHICNRALANLGDSASVASISPPDGSAQAEHCAMFYPMTRDLLLSMHPWSWATKRVSLAEVTNASGGWAHCYAQPSDMLAPLAVLAQGAPDDGDTALFAVETGHDGAGVIYTDQADAVLRYTFRQTDPTRFSPMFEDCLATALSAALAGPIVKGDAGAAAAARWTLLAFGRDGRSGKFGIAAAADASTKRTGVRDAHRAPWQATR